MKSPLVLIRHTGISAHNMDNLIDAPAAIETIEEFAVFAGSLTVLRPPLRLPVVLLIFFDFFAALTIFANHIRARAKHMPICLSLGFAFPSI